MGNVCDLRLQNAQRMVNTFVLVHHFQDLGHSFSLYGPPSRLIIYMFTIVLCSISLLSFVFFVSLCSLVSMGSPELHGFTLLNYHCQYHYPYQWQFAGFINRIL